MAKFLLWPWYLLVLCLVISAEALSESLVRNQWQISKLTSELASKGQIAIRNFWQILPKSTQRSPNLWEMVQITALCGAVPGIWFLQRYLRKNNNVATSWRSASKQNGIITIMDDSNGKYIPTYKPYFSSLKNYRRRSSIVKKALRVQIL